ncbi:MAG TPA: M24 family metallopeptidase [Acidobacteriaceae bacterium]|nr:M24 family metallopeptidase [Acidobacteriaceae bacterium]
MMVERARLSPSHSEIDTKLKRLAELLDRNSASVLALSRHGNIAWITAGQVEARVGLGSETAVCQLVVRRDGKKYYLAPNNEAARLADEEFAGLGYEPVIYPWDEGPGNRLHELACGGAICADTVIPDAKTVDLTALRTPLLAEEVERLCTLGKQTAEATVEVLEGLQPGVTEREMAGRVSESLWKRGIAPSVLLMGTDERIFKYKHAAPRAGVLDRYGMVNLCARRWGLVVSITRFVHFGTPEAELVKAFEAAARIHAAMLHATKDGVVSSEIFAAAQRAYAAAGAAGEIERHHQGGPCGYAERDWLVTPCGIEHVTAPQAFAYNPSLHGAKAEDTVVLADGKIKVVTETPQLPVLECVVDGISYRSAGLLVRDTLWNSR